LCIAVGAGVRSLAPVHPCTLRAAYREDGFRTSAEAEPSVARAVSQAVQEEQDVPVLPRGHVQVR